MRRTADRIRHTALFELGAIISASTIGVWLLNKSFTEMGALTLVLSLIAMSVNYGYNLFFDRIYAKFTNNPQQRSLLVRVLHALGFELSLLVLMLPVLAYWLGVSLWQALLIDLGFVLYFLVYAFVFNWAYDKAFPIPVATPA